MTVGRASGLRVANNMAIWSMCLPAIVFAPSMVVAQQNPYAATPPTTNPYAAPAPYASPSKLPPGTNFMNMKTNCFPVLDGIYERDDGAIVRIQGSEGYFEQYPNNRWPDRHEPKYKQIRRIDSCNYRAMCGKDRSENSNGIGVEYGECTLEKKPDGGIHTEEDLPDNGHFTSDLLPRR